MNGSSSPVTGRPVRLPRNLPDPFPNNNNPNALKPGTIGVSAYAAKALGDVVYVELPSLDLEVNAGESIGAIESVKSASDIMTPVAGKIVEANSVLEDKPSTINASPEGDGWLAKIEVADAAQVDSLMDAGAYKSFTEEADK